MSKWFEAGDMVTGYGPSDRWVGRVLCYRTTEDPEAPQVMLEIFNNLKELESGQSSKIVHMWQDKVRKVECLSDYAEWYGKYESQDGIPRAEMLYGLMTMHEAILLSRLRWNRRIRYTSNRGAVVQNGRVEKDEQR